MKICTVWYLKSGIWRPSLSWDFIIIIHNNNTFVAFAEKLTIVIIVTHVTLLDIPSLLNKSELSLV